MSNALDRYLEEQGHGAARRLAVATGIPEASISKMRAGRRSATLAQALAIEYATDGAVPVQSWNQAAAE